MKVIHQQLGKRICVLFEADDVNDPDWNRIIRLMHENNISVLFGDGNNMCFEWSEEWEEN